MLIVFFKCLRHSLLIIPHFCMSLVKERKITDLLTLSYIEISFPISYQLNQLVSYILIQVNILFINRH